MPLGSVALLISTTMRAQQERLTQRDLAPRSDYAALSHALDAEVVDFARLAADRHPEVHAAGRLFGEGFAHALWAYLNRNRYDLVFSDGERTGIPLAWLLKRHNRGLLHVMVAHRLSPWKKALPLRLLHLHTHIDRLICHGERQQNVAIRLGVPPEKIRLVRHGVDQLFWRPLPFDPFGKPSISSVEVERYDLGTLVAALRGIGVDASLCVKRAPRDSLLRPKDAVSAAISAAQLNSAQLRALYARSRFVVLPLSDRGFQSGIRVVLEAMAMGKAIIVSHTRDIVASGVVRPGENGLLVPPGDAAALREAILYLWLNPSEAEAMGRAGRRLVEESLTLDRFVGNVKQIIVELFETLRRLENTISTTRYDYGR